MTRVIKHPQWKLMTTGNMEQAQRSRLSVRRAKAGSITILMLHRRKMRNGGCIRVPKVPELPRGVT